MNIHDGHKKVLVLLSHSFDKRMSNVDMCFINKLIIGFLYKLRQLILISIFLYMTIDIYDDDDRYLLSGSEF